MIPSLPLLRLFMFVGSATVHVWLALWIFQGTSTQIEGGSVGSPEARLGNSFEDFATGVLTPETDLTEIVEPVNAVEPTETLDQINQVQPPPPLKPTELVETPPTKTVETVSEVEPEVVDTVQIQPALTVDTVGEANVPLPVSDALEPIEPVETTFESAEAIPAESPTALAAVPIEVTEALQPELETLTARETNIPVVTVVPKPRPERVEPQRQRTTQSRTRPSQRGNASQNAVAGSTTGSTTARAVQRSANTGNSRAEGNAAATNYPGVVMRKISRVRKPRVRVRSVATVRFVIDSSGSLSAVSIAKSSGNAELDAAAIQVIRRAAPFPAPPRGAQRSFTIRVRGRG